MTTDQALWPTLANAVGRAADVEPAAVPVLEDMLDQVEKREANGELSDGDLVAAIRFCGYIAEQSPMGHANLMLGWRPPRPCGPFLRLVPDLYPDQATLDAAKRERVRKYGAIPNVATDWPENLR